jgi:hypothetical protein
VPDIIVVLFVINFVIFKRQNCVYLFIYLFSIPGRHWYHEPIRSKADFCLVCGRYEPWYWGRHKPPVSYPAGIGIRLILPPLKSDWCLLVFPTTVLINSHNYNILHCWFVSEVELEEPKVEPTRWCTKY